jgi:hypothetical protein
MGAIPMTLHYYRSSLAPIGQTMRYPVLLQKIRADFLRCHAGLKLPWLSHRMW